MTRHHKDYVWKEGIPYGIQFCDKVSGPTYKIVSDPYRKRITVEEYVNGDFRRIIYDSALFDFRQLKLGEQLAWQKTQVSESGDHVVCHIRNQDDRLILVEEYTFEGQRCRECRAFSPLGVLLSVQKMSYRLCNDLFDGVVLLDSNEHPVMSKRYEVDERTKEFSQLLEEKWDLYQ